MTENATVSYEVAALRFLFFFGGSSAQSTKVKGMSRDGDDRVQSQKMKDECKRERTYEARQRIYPGRIRHIECTNAVCLDMVNLF